MNVIATIVAIAYAGSAPIFCPAEISVRQELMNAPQGWAAHNAHRPARWSSVIIYYGEPSQNALQTPEVYQTSSYDEAIWRFPHSDVDLWMACVYSETSIELTKNIGRPSMCGFRLRRDVINERLTFRCEYSGNPE